MGENGELWKRGNTGNYGNSGDMDEEDILSESIIGEVDNSGATPVEKLNCTVRDFLYELKKEGMVSLVYVGYYHFIFIGQGE